MFSINCLDRWHKDRIVFLSIFKDVIFGADNESIWFEGWITINTSAGREFGPFRMKVRFSKEYYLGLLPPDAYLMSHRNKWLNVENSHIEKNWRLCLFVPLESEINFDEEDSFIKFIERLGSFLIDSSRYQQEVQELGVENAKWRGRQRGHGVEGIIQALNKMQTSLFDFCPCESGHAYIDCHHGKSLKMYMNAFRQKNLLENLW